jgi:hypothetical protein
MTDFQEQSTEIRQFLLGQFSEKRAEEVEERIFREPDFAEDVRIIESELIADYHLGKLSPEERNYFERKYLDTPAGLLFVRSENALDDFIRARLEETKQLSGARLAPATTTPSETLTTTESPRAPREKLKREGWLGRLFSSFTARHGLVYATLLFVLLAAGFLLLSTRRLTHSPGDDSAQAEQRAKEEELALLNRDVSAPRGKEVASIELKPTQRNEGSMPRINVGDAGQDGLIKLRLNLMQSGPARYRAIFLDDRRKTLFAIQDLMARETPSGPQVWLFVPVKYFRHGDYQIDLGGLGGDGAYTEDDSYSFRVIDEK